MKKVKATIILVAIRLVMILNEMFRTIGSLKAFNYIDGDKNTTPMRALKDEFLKCKVFSGIKIVQLANDRSGKKIFALMSTWVPVITATVNAPEDSEGRAKLAETIQTAAAKTLYVTINPLLYGTVLTALIAAMRAAKGANEIDKAWGDLNKQLKKIMAVVQTTMDDDVTDSAAIICEYYEFHVKGKGGDHTQVFSGEPGVAAGEIDLVLPKGADGSVYDIKLWSADRTTFTRAQPSDITHATVGGLVSGSLQNVSVAEIRHGKLVRESQIIAVRVK
jgi:hypothetical protein